MILFALPKTTKPQDLTRSEWERLVDERVLGRNGYRDRQIMKENLLDGRTYEWIAEKYDLSVRQVGRIIRARKRDLYK